ncbi:MAG: DedA family protein [Bdellovibrionales bacterium]|nr:DedA family protein [Bdellovibrionales bacterium]
MNKPTDALSAPDKLSVLSKIRQLPRQLYDWVLSWADTPYGSLALFVLAFLESSFFPIPPDVLLVALVLGARSRWAYYATLCTVGSALGGIAGYGIGYLFMDTLGQKILDFYHAHEMYQSVLEKYQLYDFWIVFSAAFTPIPYKVFTIASGAFKMNIAGFFAVSLVGRGLRFFMVAILLYRFGEPVKRLIDKYFDLLCIAFLILLIGGFAIIKYI